MIHLSARPGIPPDASPLATLRWPRRALRRERSEQDGLALAAAALGDRGFPAAILKADARPVQDIAVDEDIAPVPDQVNRRAVSNASPRKRTAWGPFDGDWRKLWGAGMTTHQRCRRFRARLTVTASVSSYEEH